MASTFTTNFGFEEIATGEQSGTWGKTTNFNLDILDRIASYKAVGLSGTTHTLTVREASPGQGTENLQDGMYRVIKFTGALGGNNTVTVAPNTSTAYFIFENATTDSGSSGPYSVIISQGSGANVTIENGNNAIVYCDGAGSGAAVTNALGDLQVSALQVDGDATIGDDLTLNSDASVLGFGANTDVTLTHVHNSGLTLKNTSTGDDTPFVLLVQTGETGLTSNDELGKIQFQAPDESSGTDAILVAAEIAATAEGTFSASSNATKLSFKTAASEAAAEKMKLSSTGVLTLNGGSGALVIPNDGNIGSASDTDAIAIASSGVVTFTQTPVFPTSASASVAVFTSSGTWTKPDNFLYAIIEVQGGGGGGGGTANPGSDEAGAGSGGGSGGYARKVLLASALGSTETVTVGAAAAGGSSSDGTDGNASTFAVASGTNVVGNGGTGGKSRASGIASVATLQGVGGGSATGGDINITGSGSGPAICMGNNAFGTSSTQALAFGSAGGSGFFGGGGGSAGATETTAQNGGDGVSGGGGGGAASGDTGAAATGGAGGAGLVIVTQYLSE